MAQVETTKEVTVQSILMAYNSLKKVVMNTPLQRDAVLSEKYQCNVYLKREDLQIVRSFKIRGAYNKISQLSQEQLQYGVVCASAGNHAQGVAYTCHMLQVPAKIFMPTTTPQQKISQVKFFGGNMVEVILAGDTFDSASSQAQSYCAENGMTYIPPFDDEDVIAGQGTLAVEVLHDINGPVDYLFGSIGGGGLMAGVGTYVKGAQPDAKIVGVEPVGASSMQQAFLQQQVTTLEKIDTFVDGAAVKRVGDKTYAICQEVLDDIVLVPEGQLCTTMLEVYNKNALVVEPAGALSIAALEYYREQIKGKNIVCIVSGGNNDIDRMQEVKERSLIYKELKHYFIIHFPQRSGALREFLQNVLGPNDDITRFEYTKKNDRENGPALVGIELSQKEDYHLLLERMEKYAISYTEINHDPTLFHLLV